MPSRLWWVIISLAASWRLHLQWWCWSRVSSCWAEFVKSTGDWQYLWHVCRRETQSAGCPVHTADHLCNCPRLCGRWLWSVRDHYCLMLFFAWCLCKSSIQKGREKMSFSKNPHKRTKWFKNVQAEIWHLNTQKYKNMFYLAKKNRFSYKKNHSTFGGKKFSILIVSNFRQMLLSVCFLWFIFAWIFTRNMFSINHMY